MKYIVRMNQKVYEVDVEKAGAMGQGMMMNQGMPMMAAPAPMAPQMPQMAAAPMAARST